MVDVPGWCDPRVELTDSGGSAYLHNAGVGGSGRGNCLVDIYGYTTLPIQPTHFDQLFFLWENNGFEVYEEICRPFAKTLDEVIGISRRTVLQFNDIFEQIQNSLKLWILYARTMEGESGSC
jgi:hypothetical protein